MSKAGSPGTRPDPANLDDRGLSETELQRQSYLRAGRTLRSWLLTHDHKRIAMLYLISVTLFFFVGGVAAALVRLELLAPGGRFLSNEGYNRTFTLHGVVMAIQTSEAWMHNVHRNFADVILFLVIGGALLALLPAKRKVAEPVLV